MPANGHDGNPLSVSSLHETTGLYVELQPDAEPIVFVVDDDEAVLRSLRRLLGSNGLTVETFASARAFLARGAPPGPSCLILDLRLPEVTGLDLQDELAESGVEIPIVFITGYATVIESVRAMKAGATDFIQKPVDEQDLLRAVELALQQDRARLTSQSRLFELRDRLQTLTPREREVLAHVVRGSMNKRIALNLGVSEKTIKVHRARVMAKMRAESLPHLVRMAGVLGVELPKGRSSARRAPSGNRAERQLGER